MEKRLFILITFISTLSVSGSVAEWSKALVLGTSLFGGAGSNPAAARIFLLLPYSYLDIQTSAAKFSTRSSNKVCM